MSTVIPKINIPTLINAQPDNMFPITQPLPIAAPIPIKKPPNIAITVCSGGLGNSLACPDILPDIKEPATNPRSTRIAHQIIALGGRSAGFDGILFCSIAALVFCAEPFSSLAFFSPCGLAVVSIYLGMPKLCSTL